MVVPRGGQCAASSGLPRLGRDSLTPDLPCGTLLRRKQRSRRLAGSQSSRSETALVADQAVDVGDAQPGSRAVSGRAVHRVGISAVYERHVIAVRKTEIDRAPLGEGRAGAEIAGEATVARVIGVDIAGRAIADVDRTLGIEPERQAELVERVPGRGER